MSEVLTLVTACTATVAPEWVRIFNPKADVEPDHLACLDDMQIDSLGNLVIAATTIRASLDSRVHDLALVKYSPSGQPLWAWVFEDRRGDLLMTTSNAKQNGTLALHLSQFIDQSNPVIPVSWRANIPP